MKSAPFALMVLLILGQACQSAADAIPRPTATATPRPTPAPAESGRPLIVVPDACPCHFVYYRISDSSGRVVETGTRIDCLNGVGVVWSATSTPQPADDELRGGG